MPKKKMLKNQVTLLVLRALVGIAGIVVGWLIYPTGRIVSSERAVPSRLPSRLPS